MTLVLRRLTLGNFRKFRDPICIEGLCAGLNVVIEPNEAGKSTLLEALRAAFFVRHSTKGQLAQSYLPHGDAVGPEISVAFDVAGNPWHVSKRFLRGASVELEGPAGRAQGEDAEVRLQELLGAARGSSSRVDPATQGVLGLLWVMQGDGLDTRPPGPMVRDAVHATLEGEVGAILDDPLAYSDDARLEIMSEILVDAAQRMQIIILTCRDRAFRHLPGTHLRIANVG